MGFRDHFESEVLGEVLSEVFTQHLTLRIAFLQRCFRRKSEVMRSFWKNSFCALFLELSKQIPISDFVSLDACGAYSSFASLKKILTLERKNKKVVFLFCSLLTYLYLCTIACKLIRGRRAVLYMRKTFSDVCRCGSWTSQTPIITTGRWQPKRHVVRFYIPIYIVRAGVG